LADHYITTLLLIKYAPVCLFLVNRYCICALHNANEI